MSEMIAHLVRRRGSWRIFPVPTVTHSTFVEDRAGRAIRFKTVESARAGLESRGYTLGDVRW